ncbi:acyl-CoA/acyl-ACP dehydrogenase [Kribbella sandramycini]|uniref:Acyl-CoA/acyl-ACP dehydrogenase n=1 Tax=Kribbella sandramycini TaxID=60450 RepID=A0A7Y4L1S2_9ACTN|nr:acyl-CoA dehydrogenase family protein [Kribbella sandramycini]MBB6566582.1 alkylation response protein AidB-like acyl-CoA dehydrogenase [Kribbella sandramycini]NOL42763.1 acyl-CoA/acyl-ACP dehydrogenase [Kribbella sandramycini]
MTTTFAGIASRATQTDATASVPVENWQELKESGYFGLFHPEHLGGSGADAATQVQAMEALGRACSGTYWTATVSALLCGNLIATYGDERHHHLVRALATGEKLAAFAIVETAAGSDASTYQTLVRRTGGGYTITGEKSRITNAPRADIAVTLARRERAAGDDGPEWCLAFVELDQPGVRRYEIPHMGLRAMPWGGIVYTDAHVDEANVIPVPFTELAEGMTWGWLLVSIAAVATAESALAASVRHASERVSFGRPLAHMEGVHAQLADSRAQIDAARVLALRAATERVAGNSAKDLIGMLKVYATEMAVEVTQRAVQIHGAFGVTEGHEVERHYRDAQMNVVGAFATNRLREQLAENLGLGPAVYRPFDWLTPSAAPESPPKATITTTPSWWIPYAGY